MGEKKQKRKSGEKSLEPVKTPEGKGLWHYAEKLVLDNSGPERIARILLLAVLTILCLLPFADKAFHIDDPLFVWTAKNIQTNPLDPYGFDVNWYGTWMRMADVNKNPPIVSYYIAIVAIDVESIRVQ